LAGCDGEPFEPVPDDALTPIYKVDRQEYSFPYDLDDEDPIIECNGELMQPHGTLLINIRAMAAPSGNLIVSGRVDYGDDVWLEGLESGEVWTLSHSLNPYGEVYKENGFYVLHFHIHEWYTNPELGKRQVRWWGNTKVDKNGNPELYRETIACK
jgi:hypothetical protein